VLVIAFRKSLVDSDEIASQISRRMSKGVARNPFQWMRYLPHFSRNPYVRSLALVDYFRCEAKGEKGGPTGK
jgi:hypothetical protein